MSSPTLQHTPRGATAPRELPTPRGRAHRSGAPSQVGLARSRFGLNRVTAADAEALGRVTDPLSLSLLMATTPAERMGRRDRTVMQELARDAARRLSEEPDAHAAAAVRAGLAAAMARAVASPTDRGLAILVSPEGAHVLHLRVAPRDRVVLDPSFATRDLVRSAAEDPPFLLLALDSRAARLFEYDQRYLGPVLAHDFPMLRDVTVESSRPAADPGARREASRAFLRQAAGRLRERLVEGELPVVLVAGERTAAEFLALGGAPRIAAVVHATGTRMSLGELEERGRAALAEHVSDAAAAALDMVHVRLAQRRAVAGLTGAWQAVRQYEPEVLVVERSFAPAVRPDGGLLAPAADPEEVGVVDDMVDELIEVALARGAQVVAVPDGSLARYGRVVLAVRGRVADLQA